MEVLGGEMPKAISFNPVPQQPIDMRSGKFTVEAVRFFLDIIQKVNSSSFDLSEIETIASDAFMVATTANASVPADTESLQEGLNNLYYTQERRENVEAFAFFVG